MFALALLNPLENSESQNKNVLAEEILLMKI